MSFPRPCSGEPDDLSYRQSLGVVVSGGLSTWMTVRVHVPDDFLSMFSFTRMPGRAGIFEMPQLLWQTRRGTYFGKLSGYNAASKHTVLEDLVLKSALNVEQVDGVCWYRELIFVKAEPHPRNDAQMVWRFVFDNITRDGHINIDHGDRLCS